MAEVLNPESTLLEERNRIFFCCAVRLISDGRGSDVHAALIVEPQSTPNDMYVPTTFRLVSRGTVGSKAGEMG